MCWFLKILCLFFIKFESREFTFFYMVLRKKSWGVRKQKLIKRSSKVQKNSSKVRKNQLINPRLAFSFWLLLQLCNFLCLVHVAFAWFTALVHTFYFSYAKVYQVGYGSFLNLHLSCKHLTNFALMPLECLEWNFIVLIFSLCDFLSILRSSGIETLW